MRGDDAVHDALDLLREAAPSPEGAIDLDAVAAVFWTFWLRHEGTEDPDAARNVMIVLSTFGFLSPRVPAGTPFPPPLVDDFDPADPTNDARFAFLISSVHGDSALTDPDLAESGQLAALDRALLWSDAAQGSLPDGHEGFVELGLHALGLHTARFRLAADPDSLAVAARNAAAVYVRLPYVEPTAIGPAGTDAPAIALGAVLDAAWLLGEPSLPEVERLIAAVPDAAPDTTHPPQIAEALRFLRQMAAEPVSWPGELDLLAGQSIVEAGTSEHDASQIACGIRRLRVALTRTPVDHPSRSLVAVALSQALEAFAEERGDDEAGREAAREATELFAAAMETDPERLLGIVGQLREGAARDGKPPDIELEILALAASFHSEPDADVSVSDEQITHYRTALAALPADSPHRYAYVAVLAALTGARAQELRETEPARADQLLAQASSLTDEVADEAPAGFLPLGLLRPGLYDGALVVAVMSVPTRAPDAEMVKLASQMSRLADLRLEDPEQLDADIVIMRELLEEVGEDESSVRAPLSAMLAGALSAHDDSAFHDEIVQLLRYAHAHRSELVEGVDQQLALVLTRRSAERFDAEAARESAALLATAATEGPPADVGLATLSFFTEFQNALQNYVLGHEPGQLVRAREIAGRLREFTGDAGVAGAKDELPELPELPELHMVGDIYADVLESTGLGSDLASDITDDQIDRYRRTFMACPVAHEARSVSGMTLVWALAQRAVAIHGTEPERAAGLVGEAESLIDTVGLEEGVPARWVDLMRTTMGLLGVGAIEGSLSSPAASSDRLPYPYPYPSPESALVAWSVILQAGFPGIADSADSADSARPASFPASFRVGQAIVSAYTALEKGRTDVALDHLEAAVDAMADITDRGSDQESAEYGLRTYEGGVRLSVAMVLLEVLNRANGGSTVAGPDIDRAAAVLERGRGLLLARRIEARADIDELRAAHPELSREFERLTDQLAADPDPPNPPDPPPAGHAEWSRLARLRASRQLDELVGTIRTRPGFDGFLRPLSAEQLRALAADGPVVVLNQAASHGQALVVTDRSITALLLQTGSDEIADMTRRLRDAVDAVNARGSSRPSPAQLVTAGATIRETLAWTWHTIVRPVLDIAGSYGPVPDQGIWPRIWWVPTGDFNTLPLHAAQCTRPECELGGCGAALDVVMSSYVPGFQTLAYARGRAEHRGGADNRTDNGAHNGAALLVASPEDELPGVAAAAGYAAELLGAHQPLIGAAATREAVLDALGSTSWVHFGCHAATDPAEPSGALLHLPNGETLSVLEICRTRPLSARLAFLAACGTARTSERLSDEAIHITSAFLLAGFPSAVGTLWEIDSTHAEQVTRDFYRRMTYDGTETATATATAAAASAQALHHTVRELRRRIPDRPHVWAAYVHAGT